MVKIQAIFLNLFYFKKHNAFLEQEDIKDISDSDSDYSSKKKKRKCNSKKKRTKNEIDHNKLSDKLPVLEDRKKVGRPKRKQAIKEEDEHFLDQNQIDLNASAYLELSEEYIASILQQVDELCENIKNGDPDIERTLEINNNLNNAVGTYRVKLIELKAESENIEPLKTENPLSDYENSDSEFIPLKKKKRKAEGIKKIKNIGKNKLIDTKFDDQENYNQDEIQAGSELDISELYEIDTKSTKLSNEKKLRGPGRPVGSKNPENDLKAELAKNQCGKHKAFKIVSR